MAIDQASRVPSLAGTSSLIVSIQSPVASKPLKTDKGLCGLNELVKGAAPWDKSNNAPS